MPELIFSCALVALGVVGYLATGRKSATALVPAFFGAVAGASHALSPDTAGPAVVIAVAVLGLLGTGRALVGCLRQGFSRTGAAARAKALMALSCVAYLLARGLGF